MNLISKKDVYILIPVFNEEKVILSLIKSIKKEGYKKIIVVDDGSSDNTINKIKKEKCIIASHLINLGKGAAVNTGWEIALKLKTKCLVTMDGDGQHSSYDIKKFIKKINQGYDVVLGTREFKKNMPLINKTGNYIAKYLTGAIYGIYVSDSQCGFRAYSEKALKKIKVKSFGYEFDSKVIGEIKKHNLKYTEVLTKTIYTKYSLNKKHKQGFINGINTLIRIIFSN